MDSVSHDPAPAGASATAGQPTGPSAGSTGDASGPPDGHASTETATADDLPAHHVVVNERHPTGTRAVRGLVTRVPTNLTLALIVGVGGGILLAQSLGAILASASTLVINIFVSLFLSFGLEPAVKWLSDRGMRRGVATGLVFVGVVAVFLGFFASMLPLVVDQAANLVENAQQIVDGLIANAASLPGSLGETLTDWLTSFEQQLPSRATDYAQMLTEGAVNVGATLVGTIFNLLTIALVTFYMTADAPRLRATLSSRLSPDRQEEFLEIWDVAIDKTGGYVYSRALTLVASATFHTVAFMLIGLDYSLALGFWVGVISSLVPVVGTYLAGVLPVIVAFAGNPTDVIWVLVVLTIYQGAENYFIAPRITAHTLSLHPAVTFLSVLLGASLLGAFGALLAIPAAAIVAALFSARSEIHPSHVAQQDTPTDDASTPPGGQSDVPSDA